MEADTSWRTFNMGRCWAEKKQSNKKRNKISRSKSFFIELNRRCCCPITAPSSVQLISSVLEIQSSFTVHRPWINQWVNQCRCQFDWCRFMFNDNVTHPTGCCCVMYPSMGEPNGPSKWLPTVDGFIFRFARDAVSIWKTGSRLSWQWLTCAK